MAAHSTPVQSKPLLAFVSYNEDQRRASLPQAATYLAGNLRVLAHQGIDGALWAISTQTACLATSDAPVPDGRELQSVYFCQDIHARSGPAAWFEIELDDGRRLVTTAARYDHATGYLNNTIPQTALTAGPLHITISTIAPLSREADQRRRPAGVIYRIELSNTGQQIVSGRLLLRVLGHSYIVRGGVSKWTGNPRRLPAWDDGRKVLVCSSAESVSLVISGGDLFGPDKSDPTCLARPIDLSAGQSLSYSIFLAFETDTVQHLPNLAELTGRSVSEWQVATLDYWKEAVGYFTVSWDTRFSDFAARAVQEALCCIRLNGQHDVVGVAPSPTPVDEEPEFSDIMFISIPALYLDPKLYHQIMVWYASNHSVGDPQSPFDARARVTPAVMAGLLYRATGQVDFLRAQPVLVSRIQNLLQSVVERLDVDRGLYPTEVIRRHKPLMAHELGTNIECWAAFNMWSSLLNGLGMTNEAQTWEQRAQALHTAIQREFVQRGPDRIDTPAGGWLWGGLRFMGQSTLGALLYYEDDGLDVAMAPFLGFCGELDRPWINTMEYMFSPCYEFVKRRPDTLLWWEPWNANGLARQEKWTSPSLVARLASVIGDQDLGRTMIAFDRSIDVNGTLWAHAQDRKARTMRSGREMGAAFGVLLQRLLGIGFNASSQTVACQPRRNWRTVEWRGPAGSCVPIAISYAQGEQQAHYVISNRTDAAWKLQVGFQVPRNMQVVQARLDGQPCASQIAVEDDWQDVLVECTLLPRASADVRVQAQHASHLYEPVRPRQ
jgi:hypothetical protein